MPEFVRRWDLVRRRRGTIARCARMRRPAGPHGGTRRGAGSCAGGGGRMLDLVARRANTLAPQGNLAELVASRPAGGGEPRCGNRLSRGCGDQSGSYRPLWSRGIPALWAAAHLLWERPRGLRCPIVQESAGVRRVMPVAIACETRENNRGTRKMKTIPFGRTLGLLSGLIGYSIHMNNLIVAT